MSFLAMRRPQKVKERGKRVLDLPPESGHLLLSIPSTDLNSLVQVKWIYLSSSPAAPFVCHDVMMHPPLSLVGQWNM